MSELETWGESEKFYEWMFSLTNEMTRRYRRQDIRGMRAILTNLQVMEADVREENFRSSYSTAIARCITLLAMLHLDLLEFEHCISRCVGARSVLEHKARRRRDLDLSERPDTLAWAMLGAVLGDAKWKGPPEIRDSVLTPSELIDLYYKCENQLRHGLRRYPRVDMQREVNAIHELFWFGLHAIKTALRYEPDHAHDLIDYFAEWHENAPYELSSPAYHDIEMARLFLNNSLTTMLAVALHANRRRTLRKMMGDRIAFAAYDASSTRERDYLLKCQPQIIELTRQEKASA